MVLLALSWAEPYGALAAAAQHWGTLADRARATGELLGPEEGGAAAAPPEPAEAAEPEARVCRLRLVEAAFAHPGAPPLWTDLELDLAPGDVAVVTGPSGSGKSTLLRCINHLERPDAGYVRVNDDLIGYREGGHRGDATVLRELLGSLGRVVGQVSLGLRRDDDALDGDSGAMDGLGPREPAEQALDAARPGEALLLDGGERAGSAVGVAGQRGGERRLGRRRGDVRRC